MARAFGEALAVQMVIGNSRNLFESLLDPAGTLTTIITLNMGHTTYGSVENNTLVSGISDDHLHGQRFAERPRHS